MALATLSIDLEARLAKLQDGFDRAARVAEQQSARIGKAFEGTRAALLAAGGALTSVFSAGLVAQFVRDTLNGVDALNDFADAVGTTVENASALEDVARRTGATLDTVTGAALKLNQQLNAATPDSPIAQALERIGLSAEDLRNADPAEALLEVSRALAQYEDDGNKARLVQELFGKSVREVGPFLKDLAEQTRLVGSVTAEQAAEVEKLNKALFELGKTSQDLARAIALPLVTALNETIAKFREGREAGESFFQTLRREQLRLLGLADAAPTGSRRASGRVTIAGAPFGTAGTEDRGFRPSVGDRPAEDAAARAVRGARTAAERPLGAIRSAAEQYKADFLASEREAYEDIDRFIREADARGRQLATAILDPIEARKSQFLLAEKEGYEATERALRDTQQQIERTSTVAADLGLSFSSAFEDAIVGGNDLRSVLRGLEADLVRIVTRKLVTEPLAEAASGFLGSLFASSGGAGGGVGSSILGAITSAFSGFFATGGFIAPGRWGIAGERGPEPVFGGRTGATVQPAGGVTVVINQTFSGGMDARTRSQVAADTARAVERAALRNN
jgi:hypothetical protein